jgi:hypothetical protein
MGRGQGRENAMSNATSAAVFAAVERAKRNPPGGRAWSVCLQACDRQVLASFSVASYEQVLALRDELALQGYWMAILDAGDNWDFVFQQQAEERAAEPVVVGRAETA